jgi:hypothetical protein
VTDAIVYFLAELREQTNQDKTIEQLEWLMREAKLMAKTDPSMGEFLQAMACIVGRSDCTLKEKIASIHKLCATPDDSRGHA